jgi:CRISPR-associated protein Cmr2
MNYLFLVTIGPIQGFIDSARRTRDLACGSWLLSELSKAAAHEIMEHNRLESLIFPAPSKKELLLPDSEFIVANKIITLVQQAPENLGPLVHDAVKTRLRKIRDRAYTGVLLPQDKRAIAEAQIDDLIEVLWAGLPFDGSQYRDARKLLVAIMDARKNTRDFAQVTWGSIAKKSSIDGQLESVIPNTAYDDPKVDRRTLLRELYEKYGARPAERLSGVDLLKRRSPTTFGTHFPSTSHMATRPFLQRLGVLTGEPLTKVQEAWDNYIDVVQKHAFSAKFERVPTQFAGHPILTDYDGSLLFEDRLVDVLYAPGVELTRDKNFQEARSALQDFYKVLDQQFANLRFGKAHHPNPYYALLRADGDSMGEVIDAQAGSGYQQHRHISQQLSSFADQVKRIVSKHQGALVYTGGDDVLAFLPLHEVLACASELANEFRKTLQKFAPSQGPAPSLSVGIAIAHHLDSLRRVRQIADQAEKRAKRVQGKSALAITISKRSGESYSVAGHWDELDTSLQRLSDFCYEGVIPVGTAYELRDLVVRLGISIDETYSGSQEEKIGDLYAEVIKWDALRIVQRKLYVPLGKAEQKKAETVENFFKARLGIGQASHPVEEHIGPLIREVINELIIAQVLADARRLATPTKEARLI